MRMVDKSEWDLSGMVDRQRAAGLLDPPPANDLIEMAAHDAKHRALSHQGSFCWQRGKQMIGCSRAVFVIKPLSPICFDLMFNGRSCYRGQYYLSVHEGQEFNRLLVNSFLSAAEIMHRSSGPKIDWHLVRRSLLGPWSKVWVFDDETAFGEAPEHDFRPRRWSKRASIWLRAPLPLHPGLDLKGTWMSDHDNSYRQDPSKANRDQSVHEKAGA
jgi:hypothetical protein